MKIAFTEEFILPLPEGHRFPMEKYELVPQQLLYEGTCSDIDFFQPQAVPRAVVELVHAPGYINDLLNLTLNPKSARKLGLPFTSELIEREFLIVGGAIEACHYAIDEGVALSVAGGTHHAYSDSGEGFCIFNDVSVCARYLLKEGLAKKILIVDLDVHQGNGSAKIFEYEKRVFTFSMHGAGNYPMHKEKSDLDIALPDNTNDATYLTILEQHLRQLIKHFCPDFILYVAGVDVLATDRLGKLALTKEGCKRRDELVLKKAFTHHVPILVTMGGGYSEKISDIVEAHCNTYRSVKEIYY